MLEHKPEPWKVSKCLFLSCLLWSPHVQLFIVFPGVDLFNEDNPYKQTNLQSLDTLTRDSKITALSWADENTNELLVGRGDSVIRTFDCSRNQFCDTDLDIPEGRVVGLAWNNE